MKRHKLETVAVTLHYRGVEFELKKQVIDNTWVLWYSTIVDSPQSMIGHNGYHLFKIGSRITDPEHSRSAAQKSMTDEIDRMIENHLTAQKVKRNIINGIVESAQS